MNRQESIKNAPAEKRYKNFISTATDREEIWVLENKDGYATWDSEGCMHLMVFPMREDAELFAQDDEKPVAIGLTDFLHRCIETLGNDEFGFYVFPNEKDGMVVSPIKVMQDLLEELKNYI